MLNLSIMSTNTLYPIFLKLENMTTLIVGGGKVAVEKLYFMLKNSPNAHIRMVSESYSAEALDLIGENKNVEVITSKYHERQLSGISLVIAATNNRLVNQQIKKDANALNVLVNVADTPDLCQFYLGGIVTKGDLKIAFSTNGKSPVLAKRLRGFFEQVIPENIQVLLDNLDSIRKKVRPDLKKKTALLNNLTSDFMKM